MPPMYTRVASAACVEYMRMGIPNETATWNPMNWMSVATLLTAFGSCGSLYVAQPYCLVHRCEVLNQLSQLLGR
jgi:hypothetical protein